MSIPIPLLTSIPIHQGPRAGSGVVRIDLLCFLARCCKRRLNQVLSILCPSMFFSVTIYLGPFYVSLICVGMYFVFWLFWLSYQYLPSDWLERLLGGSLIMARGSCLTSIPICHWALGVGHIYGHLICSTRSFMWLTCAMYYCVD